jgi:uncharacterized protein (TIGR02453 family)
MINHQNINQKNMPDKKFDGFSKETITFLKGLEKNNNKAWFDKNRDQYDSEVMDRAKAFVEAMGEKVHTLSPGVEADPRVNRSIFRINRDTRFSKDKSPYKTWLAIRFWEGPSPKVSPCFYFHLSSKDLMLGYGMYGMDKKYLEAYRKSIDNPRLAKELDQIIKNLAKKKIKIEGKTYKQVPRGYDKDHKYAELLKYSGLYAGKNVKYPKELYSKSLVTYCMREFKKYTDLHQWLVKMVKRA